MINCIDECGGPSQKGIGAKEIVSGSRDGKVKVWDPRTNHPITTIEPSNGNLDCWAVCFGNAFSESERCVAVGYDNGDVRLVDLRTFTIRWQKNVGNGVCGLSFDRMDIPMNKLSVSCLEGQLNIYDMRTFNPKTGFAGLCETVGKSTTWSCQYLPQNRDIMAITCGDGSIRICKYQYPMNRSIRDKDGMKVGVVGSLETLALCDSLASQPIIGFDWHISKKGLIASASLDNKLSSYVVTGLE